jgi:hypothetical protein
MESCPSSEVSTAFSFSDEDFPSDMVSVGLSGTVLASGLVEIGSGISKFDTEEADSSLRCFLKLRSPLPRSLGRITGLPGLLFPGVCSGVFVFEFHTPLTSQPLSMALIPKGTSSSWPLAWTISPRSSISATSHSEYFLILLLLRQRIPNEKKRTTTCDW